MLKKLLLSDQSHGILLVQAGTDDWEPTQDELDQLTNMFMTALSDPENAAILTVRRGVTVEFIPVPKEWFGRGWKLIPDVEI